MLNATGKVVLSDFGIAVVQRTLTSLSTQSLVGTPLYMAPEQIQYKPCAASDQYALGIVVYEWLMGEVPFQGPLYALLNPHLHQPPPSLRERLPDLPAGVEEVVFQALAKDPQQRFASVGDFSSALEEACDATHFLAVQGLFRQRTPCVSVEGERGHSERVTAARAHVGTAACVRLIAHSHSLNEEQTLSCADQSSTFPYAGAYLLVSPHSYNLHNVRKWVILRMFSCR